MQNLSACCTAQNIHLLCTWKVYSTSTASSLQFELFLLVLAIGNVLHYLSKVGNLTLKQIGYCNHCANKKCVSSLPEKSFRCLLTFSCQVKKRPLFLLFSFGPNRTLIWPNSDIHSAQFGHSFGPIQTFIRPNSDIHLAQFRHSFGPIPTFIWPIRTFIWRS